MRFSRTTQLYQEEGSLHMFWRCHNKEFYLRENSNKDLYLACVKEGLKEKTSKNNVLVHAFCVMSNHFHQFVSYKNGSRYFSKYMHQAHTLFGAKYNKIFNRSGKVAESRPKTSLIENADHDMRVHFYIEANPIRAGICKQENLHRYKYSSYGFYAFGRTNEFTYMLTIPEWYLELGKTAQERQSKYRRLFAQYLKENPPTSRAIRDLYKQLFIGSYSWIEMQRSRVKTKLISSKDLMSTA